MTDTPRTFKKLQATAISSDFRSITKIVEEPIPQPGQNEVLVRNHYVGINASDINFTNGLYLKNLKPPFDVGFEAVGEIVALGAGVDGQKWRVRQPVLFTSYGAFAELQCVPVGRLWPAPALRPELLTLLVSGLTASLALEHVGRLRAGERVLVTAAAGGTGVLAVQLAKAAGAHVIGTCSSAAKAQRLAALGCDRVINYRTESLAAVLKREYPRGVDVVYESVGGDTFEVCVDALARHGRLIVIGAISGYRDGSAFGRGAGAKPAPPLATRLLVKSASVSGFFLDHFVQHAPRHMARMLELVQSGKLQLVIDERRFVGLGAVADAIDYMYSGQNMGKVVVDLRPAAAARL